MDSPHHLLLPSPCACQDSRTVAAATLPSFITLVVPSRTGQAPHPTAAERRLPPDRPYLPATTDWPRSVALAHTLQEIATNRLRITSLAILAYPVEPPPPPPRVFR
ncbi:hypothetical protein CGRA01v4_09007 [Colletotrichum graminicola]|nr:hypothetical protein CGRA01v4_09007 [Colletotrichum graminicola]